MTQMQTVESRPPSLHQTGRTGAVCLYTPSFDPSGMGRHMLDLATELALTRDVSLLAWGTPAGTRLLTAAERGGVRTCALPPPRDPGFGPAVTCFLRRHPAEVFHVHVGTGREDFDGARAARAAGVPVVLQTQHLPWLLSQEHKQRPFFRGLREVDHVLTVSRAQRATYAAIGLPATATSTVPNGVAARTAVPGRLAARRELGLTPDQPVVLTVGRLTVMKGQRHLLDALPELTARVPDLAVVLVGDGHLRETLGKQAADLGVAHVVRFAGQRSDARALLDAADVFVLPSLTEGMPLAVLEAMEAGLPVVATRAIGVEEVVDDGVTGLLVPIGDPRALAAALDRLLGDAPLRARLGAAGRDRYLSSFTAARTAREVARVYDAVVAAR
ncbi:MAG: glycosyl transferase group 1 [Frankiales bacterium]|nr:glycosyl transferase group 1 [Frankiales bacterium]